MNRIEITRYGNRNWAVWLDGELLVVTVYKKGAQAIAHLVTKLTQPQANPQPSVHPCPLTQPFSCLP